MALEMKYFVLKPHSSNYEDNGKNAHARASQDALYAYATRIQYHDEKLAYELWAWVQAERELESKEGK